MLTNVALEDANGKFTIAKGKQLQLVGGADRHSCRPRSAAAAGLLIAGPTKVGGTVKINAGTNLALIHPGSLDGNATINGTGSMVWSGGSFSGNVNLSTVGGVTMYPTYVKYVRNVNGGSLASSLRITVPTKIVAGTKTAVNTFELANSKLIFASTVTVPNFVKFSNGELINTGTMTFAPASVGGSTATASS